VTEVDANNLITASLFSAFLKCPTKGYFLAVGETAPDTFFTDIESRISSMYKSVATRQFRDGAQVSDSLNFGDLRRNLDYDAITYHVDCGTAVYNLALPEGRSGRHHPKSPTGIFVPVLFLPWNKPDRCDSMVLSFGALALSQVTGILADTGTLICGDGERHRSVRIGDHVARTREIINTILATWRGREPPPFALNKHCPVCDFQPKCRGLAMERDDLSLLTAMTAKERGKFNSKGVSSITQLSYCYRPRRRQRPRSGAERSANSVKRTASAARNDHKLKAVAIKKNQIHVVGAPSLSFGGVPTFLDVEGMPDRDFYYLVGLRFVHGGEQVEQSFWADGLDGEREIWESCLRTLKAIGNAQIVSYGAYESRFLRRMKDRYVLTPDDLAFVDRLIETSVNLIACIYGKIYFPAYSNSLKNVGHYLGFKWNWPSASGAAASLLRRAWELGVGDDLKRELIGYNMDDCRAAEKVADTLMCICARASGLDVVDVGSLEVGFEQTWGKFDSTSPEFAKINEAAYWDYQRDRVYLRSSPHLRSSAKRKRQDSRRSLRVNTTVGPSRPCKCPACNSMRISMNGRHRRMLFDMRFSDGGVRRWVTMYIVDHYKCPDCEVTFASDKRPSSRHRYGVNVLAYVIYNVIELHISQYKLAHIMQKMFGYPLVQQTINRMVRRAVERYRDTYGEIERRLLRGKLIHADETHVSVQGKDSYVWVFTSMEEVIYVWSETREGYVATDFLANFNGVLVSDFYSAYESVDCPQQRCLIHLIRDLNDDVHREPFNLEIKEVVHKFGAVLKPIIDTIDRFGLKAYFLRKHKLAVTRFYNALLSREYTTESAKKAQKRFKKNRDRLFTFLDYDNVPWNNNNAEHAIKAFADLRSVVEGPTTERGIRDYLILLSIHQTCVYRGIDFLGFLRSEETKLDGYAVKL
jgi:predicted RecB family nuclease